jgi:tetraacyldisaccharide 4'-kinase
MRAPAFWWRRPGAAALALSPAAALYGAAGRLGRRWTRPRKAPVPVLCVGNVVAGGAGKTPVAIAIVRRLMAAGVAPHVLTRGYGGRMAGPVLVDPALHDARAVGDEPILLAMESPTWVSRDRVAGAEAAVADGAGALVMDDGLQNPGLYKDVSLLVVDGQTGFGNGHLIPAGPLRERPAESLARVDAVIIMGEDRQGLATGLEGYPVTVLAARLRPAGAVGWLEGTPVVAFAGIGRPEKFFGTLEGLGARLAARFAFADHHAYEPDEIMRMVELAHAARAVPVTTAKDFVRLPVEARPMVRVLAVEVGWSDPIALDRVLEPIIRDAA